MTDAKIDATVEEQFEAEDPERRTLALAILAAIGGTSLLQACASVDASEPELNEMAQALSGNGTLKVVDNATNLRALTGGTTLWIAVMQGFNGAGDGGGGVFYWSTTAKADDGWLALNSGSGNSAGWRRVNPGAVAADSVTALRAMSGATKGMAILRGYSALGDGGGGVFQWSTSGAVDNAGTILNAGGFGSNSAGWRRIYSGPLNVRWFGAKGVVSAVPDGPAIQLAIDAAGTGNAVYLPSGTYKITATLNMGGARTRLFGDGNASVIYVNDVGVGAPPVASYEALVVGGVDSVIEDLRWIGDDNPFGGVVNYNPAQHAAILINGDGVIVRNCDFQYLFGHVIKEPGTRSRCHVLDCTVRDCANGINVNSNDSRQMGNRLQNTNGIETSGDRVIVSHNTFESSSGISLGGRTSGPASTGSICSDNILTNVVGTTAIVCNSVTNTTIARNIIVGCPQHGIAINTQYASSGAITICSNRIVTVAGPGHGIWVQTGINSLVQNNDLTSAGGAGILIEANGCVVLGNRLSGLGIADLALQALPPNAIEVRIGENVLVNGTYIAWGPVVLTSDSTPTAFFGAARITRPTVSGAKGGNAAVASLVAQLTNLGLIFDGTT